MMLKYFKKNKHNITKIAKLQLMFYSWFKDIRKSILMPTIYLMIFGVVMSFSLSYSVSQKLETGDFYFFYKHCFFVFVGFSLMIFFSIIDIKKIMSISFFSYGICILMLLLVLAITSGVKGANRWIDLGFISIQPSEILKPFFIIMHSLLIAKYREKNDINYVFVSCIIFLFVIILFGLEPDYGMIIIYTATLGVQILFSEIKFRNILFIGIGLLFLLILLSLTFSHVKFRILTFLGLGEGDNYQLNIALRAINEGGFFGNGTGMSKLKNLLPDAHNDFIFAVIGEEIGGFGYLMLIGFYFTIFISVLLYISYNNKIINTHIFTSDDSFSIDEYYLKRLISISIITMFFVAFTINSFVSLGLFPTKGMTLPFVSYGGSSIMSHSIMIGILLNTTKTNHITIRQIKVF